MSSNKYRNCDTDEESKKLEEASTHKSANTHAGNVFVTRDLDLWPANPKINGFLRLIVEHFCVKFGDPSYVGFWDIVRKNRQTHRQKAVKALPPRLAPAWVMS